MASFSWFMGTQVEIRNYDGKFADDSYRSLLNQLTTGEFLGSAAIFYFSQAALCEGVASALAADSLVRMVGYSVNMAKSFRAARKAGSDGLPGDILSAAMDETTPAPGLVGRVRELAGKTRYFLKF